MPLPSRDVQHSTNFWYAAAIIDVDGTGSDPDSVATANIKYNADSDDYNLLPLILSMPLPRRGTKYAIDFYIATAAITELMWVALVRMLILTAVADVTDTDFDDYCDGAIGSVDAIDLGARLQRMTEKATKYVR